MKRFLLLAALALMLPGASGPLGVGAEIKRTSYDLLDGINIIISVQNRSKKTLQTTYADSDTYDVRILDGARHVVWAWSDVHKAAPVRRTLSFAPGRNVLVVHIWDGTLADGRSIAPGNYTVHINLSDETYRPAAEIPIRFEAPVPIAAAKKLPANSAVTVAGTVRFTQTGTELVDATGMLPLSRRIGMPSPSGTYAVRGFLTPSNGQLVLTVDRFARTYDNVIAPAAAAWLNGEFGGPHAAMHAEARGGTMQFDCAHAQFGPLSLSDATHATAAGTLTREHGGPVRTGEVLPSANVTFAFLKSGQSVVVTVSTAGSFTLAQGAQPQLSRCL